MKEQVNHPAHYNAPGRKECIEEMIDIWGVEAAILWCEMTAYKYEYRAGTKDGNSEEQDLAKRKWYLDKANELRTTPRDNVPKTARVHAEVQTVAAQQNAAYIVDSSAFVNAIIEDVVDGIENALKEEDTLSVMAKIRRL